MHSKVSKHEKITTETVFPVLCIHEEDLNRKDPLVYLMTGPITGIVVSDNVDANGKLVNYHIGCPVYDVDIDDFQLFTGTVTLSN